MEITHSSKAMTSILAQIFDEYFVDVHKITLIKFSTKTLEKNPQTLDIFDDTMSACQRPIPVEMSHADEEGFNPSFYNVMFVDSSEYLEVYLEQFDSWNNDFSGLYVVVCAEEVEHETLNKFFKLTWSKHIINVILVVSDEHENVIIYSYQSFRSNRCHSCTPIVKANLSIDALISGIDLFPYRLNNFHLCTLKAGVFRLEPFTVISEDEKGQKTHTGTEVLIAQTVAKHYNFSIEYVITPGEAKWGYIYRENSTGLMGMIQENVVDFGFGTIGISVDRNKFLKSGVAHSTSTYVFAIPPGRKFTSIEKLFKPFSSIVWTCITVVFVSVFLAAILWFGNTKIPFLQIFNMEPLKTPLLNVWITFLGVPLAKFSFRDLTKTVLTVWMFMGLVVRTLYQAAMFRHLHSGETTKPEDTVKDFNEAGLYYYLFDVTRRFFVDFPQIQAMTRSITEQEDPNNKLQALARGDFDGVLVLPSGMIHYFNQKNLGKFHLKTGKDVVTTYIVGIFYPKSSSINKLFDQIILRLQAAGITNYWRSNFGEVRYKEFRSERPTAIGLDSISGVFIIWLVSLIGCFIVFLFEISTFKNGKRVKLLAM
ncbi:uncharacterized protein LOC129752922 [Uranotaenia lowii]|uniref:uncharacterized protein LOC129752922 n=1 Tax=Uranotaenia lowii TaxID=190385 RepID=UPI00247A3778|nr:uncharacterized protein LOC129752922 [Uranotaenia lowii]